MQAYLHFDTSTRSTTSSKISDSKQKQAHCNLNYSGSQRATNNMKMSAIHRYADYSRRSAISIPSPSLSLGPTWMVDSNALRVATKYYLTDRSSCISVDSMISLEEVADRIVSCLRQLSIQVKYTGNATTSTVSDNSSLKDLSCKSTDWGLTIVPPPMAQCITMDLVEFEIQLFIVNRDYDCVEYRSNERKETKCIVEVRRIHGCSMNFIKYREDIVHALTSFNTQEIYIMKAPSAIQHNSDTRDSANVGTEGTCVSCTIESSLSWSDRTTFFLTRKNIEESDMLISELSEMLDDNQAASVLSYACAMADRLDSNGFGLPIDLEYLVYITSQKRSVEESTFLSGLSTLILTGSEHNGNAVIVRNKIESLIMMPKQNKTYARGYIYRHLAVLLLCNLLEHFRISSTSNVEVDLSQPWLTQKIIPVLIHSLLCATDQPHFACISCRCLAIVLDYLPEEVLTIHRQSLVEGLLFSQSLGAATHVQLAHQASMLLRSIK